MESEENFEGEPVYLNVYNFTPLNAIFKLFGCAIYHTGVQVYNSEYWYGGHNYDKSGIMKTKPSAIKIELKESILIGVTKMNELEVDMEIYDMSRTWLGSKYEPFDHNCNDFSKEFMQRILNYSFMPRYILRFKSLKYFLKPVYEPLRVLFQESYLVNNSK